MDKLKQWVALTALGALAVLALGWFLLISPKHSTAADLKTQTATQISANSGLQAQLAQLKAQAKDLPAQQAAIAAVAAKIPDNPAQASLVRQLQKSADDASVDLANIVAGTPVAGTGNLQSMSYTLSVAGGYFETEQFLSKVESLSRAAKVTALAIAPAADPASHPVTDPAAVAKGSALLSQITLTVYDTAASTTAPAATGTTTTAGTTPATASTTTAR